MIFVGDEALDSDLLIMSNTSHDMAGRVGNDHGVELVGTTSLQNVPDQSVNAYHDMATALLLDNISGSVGAGTEQDINNNSNRQNEKMHKSDIGHSFTDLRDQNNLSNPHALGNNGNNNNNTNDDGNNLVGISVFDMIHPDTMNTNDTASIINISQPLNVPPGSNTSLGHNVGPSRHVMINHLMAPSQSIRASEASLWDQKYQALLAFGLDSGHYNVPQKCKWTLSSGTTVALGKWVSTQRVERKRGTMPHDRLMRLQMLADQGKFEWEPQEGDNRKWELRFQAMVEYAKEHGNCILPKNLNVVLSDGSSANLTNWLAGELQLKRKKKMRPDREAQFEEHLITPGYLRWHKKHDADEEAWDNKFQTLLVFGEHHGHYNVPDNYKCVSPIDGSEVKLGVWLQYQRGERRKKRLRADREEKLHQLAAMGKFAWDIVRVSDVEPWNEKYHSLLKFGYEHGHYNVPDSYRFDDGRGRIIRLGRWLGKQRRAKKLGTLKPDREKMLQQLVNDGKLLWEIMNADVTMKSWEMKYQALLAYGALHGTCNVPKNTVVSIENGREVKLGQWLFLQKTLRLQRKLKIERDLKLQQLVDEGKLSWDIAAETIPSPTQHIKLPTLFSLSMSMVQPENIVPSSSQVNVWPPQQQMEGMEHSLQPANIPLEFPAPNIHGMGNHVNMGIINPNVYFQHGNNNMGHPFNISQPSSGNQQINHNAPIGIVIYPMHQAPSALSGDGNTQSHVMQGSFSNEYMQSNTLSHDQLALLQQYNSHNNVSQGQFYPSSMANGAVESDDIDDYEDDDDDDDVSVDYDEDDLSDAEAAGILRVGRNKAPKTARAGKKDPIRVEMKKVSSGTGSTPVSALPHETDANNNSSSSSSNNNNMPFQPMFGGHISNAAVNMVNDTNNTFDGNNVYTDNMSRKRKADEIIDGSEQVQNSATNEASSSSTVLHDNMMYFGDFDTNHASNDMVFMSVLNNINSDVNMQVNDGASQAGANAYFLANNQLFSLGNGGVPVPTTSYGGVNVGDNQNIGDIQGSQIFVGDISSMHPSLVDNVEADKSREAIISGLTGQMLPDSSKQV